MLDEPLSCTYIFLMSHPPLKPEQSLGYLTGVAHRALGSRLNRLFAEAGLDLTAEQWGALAMLWNRDGLTQQDLASALGLEKSSLSRLVDGLERRGYARRVPGTEDARQKQVRLTTKADSIRDRATAIVQGNLEEARRGIREAELELCRDVLRRVLANLS
ncbi:MAG: MarR family winged helix-turn-helix transcriptional regulator [Acidobacteriota bacterium]